MVMTLARDQLLKPLQRVIGVVERKQTLPILANVLIRAGQDKLSLTGTDLEIELICNTTLEVSKDGMEFTVSGRKLLDICKSLPDGSLLEVHHEKERLRLQSGKSRFFLSTLPARDFPATEAQTGHLSFAIPQNVLRSLCQRTFFCMAQQDVRYYLNGMLLEINTGSIKAVATDGHRLAQSVASIATGETPRIQVIVPRKAVLELMRLIDDSDHPVIMAINSNHLQVTHDEFVVTSRLIEGRFPDYTKVIPPVGDRFIVVDRDVLKRSLTRVAILSNDQVRSVRFELRPGQLRIVANNMEQETAEEELALHYSSNEELNIGFNVNYLLDVLSCVNPGEVKLTFVDSNSSIRIEEVRNDTDSVFVIMPMCL